MSGLALLRTLALSAVLACSPPSIAQAWDPNGPDIPDGTSAQEQSGGIDGDPGTDGEANPYGVGEDGSVGGDGGNGGTVTSVLSGNSGATDIYSYGGNGGTGGNGGEGEDGNGGRDGLGGAGGNGGNGSNVDVTQTGNANGRVYAASWGGDGGDGGSGEGGNAAGGQGGSAGNVSLHVSSTVGERQGGEGALVTSYGGDAGAGAGNRGGNAGNLVLTVTESSHVDGYVLAVSNGGDGDIGGDSGSITMTIAGRVSGYVLAQSTGGDGTDRQANSGAISITISGHITDEVQALSYGDNGAPISVFLKGGVVDHTISASGSGTKLLSFEFDVADKAEFNAATAALTGAAAHGTVTINGHAYQWDGFTSLVNALRYTGPGDTVTVSVGESRTSAPDETPARLIKAPAKPRIVPVAPIEPTKQEAARCTSREVRAIRQTDGSVLIVSRTGSSSVVVGRYANGAYQRAAGAPDWIVTVSNDTVQVTDGGTSTSCSF